MYARVLTASLFGLSCEKTWAEVDCETGLPGFSVVGLANQPIKESKEHDIQPVRGNGQPFGNTFDNTENKRYKIIPKYTHKRILLKKIHQS